MNKDLIEKWGLVITLCVWVVSIVFAAGAMWPKIQAIPKIQENLSAQDNRLTRLETKQEYQTVILERLERSVPK